MPLSTSTASPYYRTKLRGLYTTAKADAEAECRQVNVNVVASIDALLCAAHFPIFHIFLYQREPVVKVLISIYHNKQPHLVVVLPHTRTHQTSKDD